MTSASVTVTPSATTTKAGAMVMRRRSWIGMRKRMKSCMIACPAMVPTTELEKPEASSDSMKTKAAAPPKSGVSVRQAVSISATSALPLAWKTVAAMETMAMFTRPAKPRAIITSRFDQRSTARTSSALRVGMRPCVRFEWR